MICLVETIIRKMSSISGQVHSAVASFLNVALHHAVIIYVPAPGRAMFVSVGEGGNALHRSLFPAASPFKFL